MSHYLMLALGLDTKTEAIFFLSVDLILILSLMNRFPHLDSHEHELSSIVETKV